MKKSILLILFTLLNNICWAKAPTLFIMLNVDNIIIDKISSSNLGLKNKLILQGYNVNKINFTINKQDHFYNYYKNQLLKDYIKIDTNTDDLNIEEFLVTRPTLNSSLQRIIDNSKQAGIKTRILICSNKDVIRTTTLIESLNFKIDGRLFNEIVDIVPREFFRVKININKQELIAKSAELLRKKYKGKFGQINKNDYVILIDQLPDNRFIKHNNKKDLNIEIPSFNVNLLEKKYNAETDIRSLNKSIIKIKNFIS